MKTFAAALLVSVAEGGPCLCIFDVDSTLISWSTHKKCPATQKWGTYEDDGYEKLRSEGSYRLDETFCNKCYMGALSAGSASESSGAERKDLADQLKKGGKLLTTKWNPSGCKNHGKSPLVTSCSDKPSAVPGIIKYYKDKEGIDIADADVHFYDDQPYNIVVFENTPYNAKQVSCGSTGGTTGGYDGGEGSKCGNSFEETNDSPGIKYCCSGQQVAPDTSAGATTQCGTPCHFPFTYSGKTYHACTSQDEVAPWCATKSTYDTTNWGYCHGATLGSNETVV